MQDNTGFDQIYKVSSSGGDEIALTSGSWDDCYPRWSPDGNWIAYIKDNIAGYRQVYKIPSLGGDEIAITSSSFTHGYEWDSPEWSWDSNCLTCSSYMAGYWRIMKIPADGSNESVLTSDCFPAGSVYPKWSPDGSLVAFHRGVDGYHQIFIVTTNGTANETMLTTGVYTHWYPQWSPDGNWITYQRDTDTGWWQIFKVSITTREEVQLTQDECHHQHPQWSPDGNWISYVKNDQTGCNQIYKVPADGGEQVTLTTLTLDHWYPQWSPDGEWIVYQMVFGGGSWQIYIVSSTPAGIDDQTIIPVAEYNLSNFPNPFNPNTEILFSMPAPGMVSLLIHNIKGQLVRALVENQHVKGDYHYLWDGADNYGNCVDAGLYFYTLIVNGRTAAANRLLLIK